MRAYTIGMDFGTLSGRAVLADTHSGAILADSMCLYPHGVMTDALPDGTPLQRGWALQDPQDYLTVMDTVLPKIIRKSGVRAEEIIGIGVDFTSATVLPLDDKGTPLCMLPSFGGDPHAYVKLWKHHAALREAKDIRSVFLSCAPERICRGLQIISCESQLAKVLETLRASPEIYRRAAHFAEAGDWITWQLCGHLTQSLCAAGFKGLYDSHSGFPTSDILAKLHPELENYISEKWNQPMYPLGKCIGYVTPRAAQRWGLPTSCAVAVSLIDGHAALPACGVCGEDTLLMIMGTGSTHIMLSKEYKKTEGACGVVKEGVYPSYWAYEAGQCCVGDHYDWFASHYLCASYATQAEAAGLTAQQYLAEKALRLRPGESGLLALDWWNGNRSTLMNAELGGLMIGMTLQTKPEEIYRALAEATAFGARYIHDAYRKAGLTIQEIRATGGICQKSPLIMQIYADVLQMPLHLAGLRYGSALGSAIFAAVAAGSGRGGYDAIQEAVEQMQDISEVIYEPNSAHAAPYNELYASYRQLYRYFGCDEPQFMQRLKQGTHI